MGEVGKQKVIYYDHGELWVVYSHDYSGGVELLGVWGCNEDAQDAADMIVKCKPELEVCCKPVEVRR